MPGLLQTIESWAGQFRAGERIEHEELLDTLPLSREAVARAYGDLERTHRWLGNTAEVLRRIETDPLPVKRVLDLGCGQGALLAEIRRRLEVDVTGIDFREPPEQSPVPIMAANAVSDTLPRADIAVCVCMAHHLSPYEARGMIHNVSRSCRRFIILDVVRHWLPLTLFTLFIAPLLSPVNDLDGKTSIRRAFTTSEFARIAEDGARETGGRARISVAPFYVRQVADISW